MKQIRFFDAERNIHFYRYFNTSLVLAFFLPIFCLIGMGIFGLNWGIDFTGGVEMQVRFGKDVHSDQLREVLDSLGFSKNQVQTYGLPENHEMLIRIERMSSIQKTDVARLEGLISQELALPAQAEYNSKMGDNVKITLPLPKASVGATPAETELNQKQAIAQQKNLLAHVMENKSGFKLRRSKLVGQENATTEDAILNSEPVEGKIAYTIQFMGVSDKIAAALSHQFGTVEVRRVEFVDSQVSKQLRTDGALAVLYALIAILIYVAIRFDLFFAPGAIVALLQDTFGALLVFVLARVEFNLPSVAALLTVLGVSINNTIVVYDRIRETVPHHPKNPLTHDEVISYVNQAVKDTFSRTINTTLTTLFASISLWVFASGEISTFGLVLAVGLALGAVSSTYAAPASYVFMRKHFSKKTPTSSRSQGYSREDKARGVV